MVKYLYLIFPLISVYASFYIWEILPDGIFWWSTPTLISLYAIVCIVVIVSIRRFVGVKT